MELALMIEGQAGLTWPRWQRLARAAEELGFAGLYRSDHFTNSAEPDQDSLEMWVSLTWLASHTRRLQFGPLVSPVSFRHPVFTARTARDVDDLSDGRLQLGLGAGWQQREHHLFGFDLLPLPERFARFEEGLEVITRLLRSDAPARFSGDYYQLRDARLLPHPQRPGGPPIVIGGVGKRYTLPLVARYGDEWNGFFLTPGRFRELSAHLDGLLTGQGRAPQAVRRSLMHNLVYARDEGELRELLKGRDRDQLERRGNLYGTAGQVTGQLERFAEAGVQRIMLQWLDLDAIDRLEDFARQVLPQFS